MPWIGSRNVVRAMVLAGAGGCVELPPEPAPADAPDAALGIVWPLDAGGVRPPTAPPYMGPECETAPERPLRDAAVPSEMVHLDAATASPGRFDAAQEPGVPAPVRAGQVVISELMPNPVVIDDSAGEWIELHNPGTTPLSLASCSIDDGRASARAIAEPLVAAAGDYVVIARSAQAGFAPDHVMSLSLANGDDSVALICGAVEIDRVSYGGALPARAGASLSLGSDGIFCPADTPYGDNLGTPGAPNPPCELPSGDVLADADAGAP